MHCTNIPRLFSYIILTSVHAGCNQAITDTLAKNNVLNKDIIDQLLNIYAMDCLSVLCHFQDIYDF